uniref:Uncharacterized protein n=1 Tax=Meloidogyne javanica TaxID=6303 RepID=A0A915LHU0_MELJA
MQRYQPEYSSSFNIRKSSSIKNIFNNLTTIKATIIGLFFLCQFIVNSAAPIPRSSAEVHDRSCVVRLPTHMILTIMGIKTHDDNSYVTVMAGSSNIIMPLSINHIRSAEKQRFGPYHIPCEKSYLIFNTNQLGLEWVEFKLEPEQPEDMEDNEEKICSDQGLNLVEIEYNNENRDSNESGSIDSKRR